MAPDNNAEQDIALAVKSASALLDKTISFDSEIAENKLKYSAWVAALATAGFNLAVWNFDKIRSVSWIKSYPTLFNTAFIATNSVFLLAIACSTAIIVVSNRHLASFKQERTLIFQREFIVTNHLAVFKADAEVRLVMGGIPVKFIPDLIFKDMAAHEGGALVEMGYVEKSGKEAAKANDQSYQEERVAREFEILTNSAKTITSEMKMVRTARIRDEGRLNIFLLTQQVLVTAGYLGLLVLAIPL